MKDFNFNTLRDLPVPENWIENALAIPDREEAKAIIPFWKKPRFIALAASLVLVSALSAALFLNFGNNPTVPVKPTPAATEIVWSTDENGATVATEVIVAVATDFPASSTNVSDQQDSARPTENRSAVTGASENTSSTSAPGSDRSGRTSPATENSPTEGGKTAPTTKTVPTEGGSSPVTPTEPAETDSPSDTPTQAPTPEEPPTAIPWEPGWDDPTEPSGTMYITVSIPWDIHPGKDHNVFCRLETADGEIVGEGGLFDSNRLMLFLGTDRQKNIYSYQFKNHITIPDKLKGEYVNYYIYDIEGSVLKSGTCQL